MVPCKLSNHELEAVPLNHDGQILTLRKGNAATIVAFVFYFIIVPSVVRGAIAIHNCTAVEILEGTDLPNATMVTKLVQNSGRLARSLACKATYS